MARKPSETETQPTTDETKPTETAAPKEKGPTIGSVACEALRDRATNEEALEAVRKAFPDAKTTLSSINWYRNDLRKKGEKVPSARELAKEAKEAKEAAEKAAAEKAKAEAEAKAKAEAAEKAKAEREAKRAAKEAEAKAKGG